MVFGRWQRISFINRNECFGIASYFIDVKCNISFVTLSYVILLFMATTKKKQTNNQCYLWQTHSLFLPNSPNTIGPFNQAITSHMGLKNPTDKPILFKIKTTAPKRYCVRPNSGLLEPNNYIEVGSKCNIFFELHLCCW